jgi:hypothetical protein
MIDLYRFVRRCSNVEHTLALKPEAAGIRIRSPKFQIGKFLFGGKASLLERYSGTV